MRVATFNIQHGRPAGGGRVDVGAVVAACLGLQADVLALQEVDRGVARSGGHDLLAAVAEATGMAWVWGQTMVLGDGGYGHALLVRGTVISQEVIHLPRARFARRREPRAAIVARVTVGSTELSVVAAHLAVRRRENRLQARELARRAGALPDPVVLLGDLNRTAALALPMLAPAGFALAGGSPTFPARRPVLRIDHIAVRGGRLQRVDVAQTATSDHRAVVAEIAF